MTTIEAILNLKALRKILRILFFLLPEQTVLDINPNLIIKSVLLLSEDNPKEDINKKIQKYIERYNDTKLSKDIVNYFVSAKDFNKR